MGSVHSGGALRKREGSKAQGLGLLVTVVAVGRPESGQRPRFASASWAAAGTSPLFLQLWIPPAFGCRPEYDNGLEEIVFGFEPWIIVVNLAMPFYILQ